MLITKAEKNVKSKSHMNNLTEMTKLTCIMTCILVILQNTKNCSTI